MEIASRGLRKLFISHTTDSDGELEIIIECADDELSFWVDEDESVKIIEHLSLIFPNKTINKERSKIAKWIAAVHPVMHEDFLNEFQVEVKT